MQIETAELRRIEDRLGQQQPVSDDNRRIQFERGEFRLRLRILQRQRRTDGNAKTRGGFGDGRRFGVEAASLGARRLRIDGNDLVALPNKLGERGHGEVGCA